MSNIRYMKVVKEDHVYVFKFDAGEEMELLKSMVDYAKHDDHILDWHDVFLFVKKMRKQLHSKTE